MKSIFLFLILLSCSSLAMSGPDEDKGRDETYLTNLLLAANYYWTLDNYEGYIMLFNEVELVRPQFASSFNLALAMYNLGDYKQAMKKLDWLEKRYRLGAPQKARVVELRAEIERQFDVHRGLNSISGQQLVCAIRSNACLQVVNSLDEPVDMESPAMLVENQSLQQGVDVDFPVQLTRKFAHKFVL